MYVPPLFDEQRPEVLHGLIASHPLGTVVTHGAGGLDAVHLPFEIEAPSADAPFGILRAHVSRNNPLWRQGGDAALVLFQGPSAYIAPELYENKAVHGKVVPTYNYAAVHAHGVVRAVDDPVWLLAMLDRMTANHEGRRATPWSVHDAPRDYVEKLLEQIVGIEIRVERMQGIFKLSQNRSAKDRATIAGDMESSPKTAGVANLMVAVAK
jgi:transcriptional regulator